MKRIISITATVIGLCFASAASAQTTPSYLVPDPQTAEWSYIKTDAKGKYPETVKKHTETMRAAAERGLLSIVGGCCGTTAEYTRSVAQMARHYKPRKA